MRYNAPMWIRVQGLLRDAWFLPPLVLVASALVAWKISMLVAVVTVLSCAGVFVYFAMMRYDEEGNERVRDV